MDGAIDLEVSNLTITCGGDAVEDGMGTPTALARERHVAKEAPIDAPHDVVSSHLGLRQLREGELDGGSVCCV